MVDLGEWVMEAKRIPGEAVIDLDEDNPAFWQ